MVAANTASRATATAAGAVTVASAGNTTAGATTATLPAGAVAAATAGNTTAGATMATLSASAVTATTTFDGSSPAVSMNSLLRNTLDAISSPSDSNDTSPKSKPGNKGNQKRGRKIVCSDDDELSSPKGNFISTLKNLGVTSELFHIVKDYTDKNHGDSIEDCLKRNNIPRKKPRAEKT
jgi:hypothetical protein